jgi:hypothetical protein
MNPAVQLQLVGLLCLCACSTADSDGDLLTDTLERTWGTDPRDPDSDADGLDDGAEVHFHLTDPTKADSDDDEALDGWEVSVGLDPLDASSRRYEGGWPHLDLSTKRDLLRTPAPSIIEADAPAKNFSLWSPHDQQFELYDLAKTGKPIVLYVAGGGGARVGVRWTLGQLASPSVGEPPDHLHAPLLAGDWWFVIVYTEQSTGVAATADSLDSFYTPNESDPTNLIVLLDHGFSVWGHFNLVDINAVGDLRSDYAHFAVLNQNMIVRGIDDWTALDALLAEAE